MKVEIRCKSDKTLLLPELTAFQGDLKTRSDEDVRKIARSIIDYGFSFPFFIWHSDGVNYVLDGHGRLEALYVLEAEGYEIPPLPVVYIKADSEGNAKALLLQINSLYGETSRDELLALIEEIGASIEDLSFPQVIFDELVFEPDYYPEIDTSDIDDDDIDRAGERMREVGKDNDMVEFSCKSCHGSIFVKREVIDRYLKGEHV